MFWMCGFDIVNNDYDDILYYNFEWDAASRNTGGVSCVYFVCSCSQRNNNVISLIKCIQFRLFSNACLPKSWLHAPINTLTASTAGNVILYWLSLEYEEIALNSVLRHCLYVVDTSNFSVSFVVLSQ